MSSPNRREISTVNNTRRSSISNDVSSASSDTNSIINYQDSIFSTEDVIETLPPDEQSQFSKRVFDYGSFKSPLVRADPVSSGSSSTTSLSSLGENLPTAVHDDALRKMIGEETPLLMGGKCGEEAPGGVKKTKFLMGISEKEFWFIFTGILIVNFVGFIGPPGKLTIPI